MKKLILTLILPLVYFGCKKKDVSPVVFSDGNKVLKAIGLMDYHTGDTCTFQINYNADGLVNSMQINTGTLSDDNNVIPSHTQNINVSYDRGNINQIIITTSGPMVVGRSIVSETFDYFANNKLKSYYYSFTDSQFQYVDNEEISFHYANDGTTLSYIITNSIPPIYTVPDSDKTNDTLIYLHSPIGLGTNSFVEVDTTRGSMCNNILSYSLSGQNTFDYSIDYTCSSVSRITGDYSNLNNRFQKPVWDAIVSRVPSLDPIQGAMAVAFYNSTLVPERLVLRITKDNETTTYEYIADELGNVLSIKEIVAGVTTKIINFEYESN